MAALTVFEVDRSRPHSTILLEDLLKLVSDEGLSLLKVVSRRTGTGLVRVTVAPFSGLVLPMNWLIEHDTHREITDSERTLLLRDALRELLHHRDFRIQDVKNRKTSFSLRQLTFLLSDFISGGAVTMTATSIQYWARGCGMCARLLDPRERLAQYDQEAAGFKLLASRPFGGPTIYGPDSAMSQALLPNNDSTVRFAPKYTLWLYLDGEPVHNLDFNILGLVDVLNDHSTNSEYVCHFTQEFGHMHIHVYPRGTRRVWIGDRIVEMTHRSAKETVDANYILFNLERARKRKFPIDIYYPVDRSNDLILYANYLLATGAVPMHRTGRDGRVAPFVIYDDESNARAWEAATLWRSSLVGEAWCQKAFSCCFGIDDSAMAATHFNTIRGTQFEVIRFSNDTSKIDSLPLVQGAGLAIWQAQLPEHSGLSWSSTRSCTDLVKPILRIDSCWIRAQPMGRDPPLQLDGQVLRMLSSAWNREKEVGELWSTCASWLHTARVGRRAYAVDPRKGSLCSLLHQWRIETRDATGEYDLVVALELCVTNPNLPVETLEKIGFKENGMALIRVLDWHNTTLLQRIANVSAMFKRCDVFRSSWSPSSLRSCIIILSGKSKVAMLPHNIQRAVNQLELTYGKHLLWSNSLNRSFPSINMTTLSKLLDGEISTGMPNEVLLSMQDVKDGWLDALASFGTAELYRMSEDLFFVRLGSVSWTAFSSWRGRKSSISGSWITHLSRLNEVRPFETGVRMRVNSDLSMYRLGAQTIRDMVLNKFKGDVVVDIGAGNGKFELCARQTYRPLDLLPVPGQSSVLGDVMRVELPAADLCLCILNSDMIADHGMNLLDRLLMTYSNVVITMPGLIASEVVVDDKVPGYGDYRECERVSAAAVAQTADLHEVTYTSVIPELADVVDTCYKNWGIVPDFQLAWSAFQWARAFPILNFRRN